MNTVINKLQFTQVDFWLPDNSTRHYLFLFFRSYIDRVLIVYMQNDESFFCFVAFFCSWQFIQGTTQERREWMRIVHTWHMYFMSAGYVRAYQILRRCNCCHFYASNWNYHYIDWLAGNKAAATGTSTVPQSAELKLVTACRIQIQMETETDWIELWPCHGQLHCCSALIKPNRKYQLVRSIRSSEYGGN